MAAGDIIIFNKFLEDEADELHNCSGDVWYLGLVDSTTSPTKTTADPRWGSGGSTNFATNEVTPGGNYSANGVSLSGTITDNLTITGNVTSFLGDNVSIAQHASNPTDARWGIIYNNTDAGKRAICAVDLGSVRDLSGGPFSITFPSNVIFTKTNNS